jgi:large subunit ribosomal protein L31
VKEGLHPTWYPEATVICACGNTWKTGSTIPEIRTDVCSACHPFYTGEQRIVDTEGQVDRFMKRLQARETIKTAEQQRVEEQTSPDVSIADLELGTRIENTLAAASILTTGDVLARLAEGGDQALLDIKGFGHKGLIDLKRRMRTRGYDLPETEEE